MLNYPCHVVNSKQTGYLYANCLTMEVDIKETQLPIITSGRSSSTKNKNLKVKATNSLILQFHQKEKI